MLKDRTSRAEKGSLYNTKNSLKLNIPHSVADPGVATPLFF